MKKVINLFAIILILLIQSCTAYNKQSSSLEESYNKGPVKIIYSNRNWKKYDEIIFTNGVYYSINKKQAMDDLGNKVWFNLQTEIDPSNVGSILIKDKKKSKKLTVILVVTLVPVAVLIGMAIAFNNSFDLNY